MQFDTNNKIIQLCTQSMSMEAEGKMEEALQLSQQAWEESTNNLEKFTSAHYLARHQPSIADKLKWDEIALNFALKMEDTNMNGSYSSLYLNIGKCHEDLGDLATARKNYELAHSFANYLPDDGYGNMIRSGIKNGIERTN